MKKKFLCATAFIFACLMPATNYAEPGQADNGFHVIRTISPEDESWDDLEFLGEILKDKKIVVMGEALHTEGVTFEAKSRLVKYLHQELGFDVLIFEAGRFDMWRFDNNKTAPAYNFLWLFWGAAEQTKELWEYVKKNNIELAGFDVQTTGIGLSVSPVNSHIMSVTLDTLRRNMLYSYLDGFGADSKNRWGSYYEIADSVETYINTPALNSQIPTARRQAVYDDLDAMTSFIKSQPVTPESKAYAALTSGIRQWWEYTTLYPQAGTNERMQWRDSLMAENIIDLLTEYEKEGRKAIIWMSNIHAFKDAGQFGRYSYINTGKLINEHFKSKIYTIAFTSYCRVIPNGTVSRRAGASTLESRLHETGNEYLFLTTMPAEPVDSWVNQNVEFKLDLDKLTDGLFFIDTMRNVKYMTIP